MGTLAGEVRDAARQVGTDVPEGAVKSGGGRIVLIGLEGE